jgi:hypothetical protein
MTVLGADLITNALSLITSILMQINVEYNS